MLILGTAYSYRLIWGKKTAWGQKMMLFVLEKRNDIALKDVKVGCKEEGYKLLSVPIVVGKKKS